MQSVGGAFVRVLPGRPRAPRWCVPQRHGVRKRPRKQGRKSASNHWNKVLIQQLPGRFQNALAAGGADGVGGAFGAFLAFPTRGVVVAEQRKLAGGGGGELGDGEANQADGVAVAHAAPEFAGGGMEVASEAGGFQRRRRPSGP